MFELIRLVGFFNTSLNPFLSFGYDVKLLFLSFNGERRFKRKGKVKKPCTYFEIMAVLSKMDLSPPCQHLCSPISPKKSPFSIGFSSIQFQTLESSSLTHFNGQKMAFSEELMKPKRGNLHPLHAQVGNLLSFCILLFLHVYVFFSLGI